MTTTRRRFIQSGMTALAGSFLLSGSGGVMRSVRGKIAVTMDDPHTGETPLLSWRERNRAILGHLDRHGVKAMLYVCGKRIDHPDGNRLLNTWQDRGHVLGNHSYSHMYYHSTGVSPDMFVSDIEKCHNLLRAFPRFRRYFRYPYLKEGNTEEKRDAVRRYLRNHDYTVGAVSIDASDWYVDQRMAAALGKNPDTDLSPYLNFYIRHMRGRIHYYDSLGWRLWGRRVMHTILIHHNLLNALFLGELLGSLRTDGWELIDAEQAYADPIFGLQPNIIPAGESIIWGMAKESGRFTGELRYPGEDSSYEKEAMDTLGL